MTKLYHILFLSFCCFYGFGQSTHLYQDHQGKHFYDRLDIKSTADLNIHSSFRNLRRKEIVNYANLVEDESNIYLTAQDYKNILYLNEDNLEFADSKKIIPKVKKEKGFLRNFYKSKANFFSVQKDNLQLFFNPVINFRTGKETQTNALPFQNTRGIELRGLIDDKIYFYTNLHENQVRFYNYIERNIDENTNIDCQGFYKIYQSKVSDAINGWDFANANAYFGFPISESVSFELGHADHFIGNGNRSLLLSDFSNNYFYFKLDVSVWKFRYQSLFAELAGMNALLAKNSTLLTKKYMASHYLSYKPHPQFEIGIFEAVIYGRENHFEFQYLNPVIMYRTAELQLNSPDNVMIGINGKWNLFKRISLFGQLLLDEFKISELTSSEGWWGNKFGMQAGIKYIDAFGLDDLDIHAEMNFVRPFTYSHRDTLDDNENISIANYSHYSQPLAHPLGSNFIENILILKYSGIDRITLESKIIMAKKGEDSFDTNFGGNILEPSGSRFGQEYGYGLTDGVKANISSLSFLASYELSHNCFIEMNVLLRSFDSELNSRDLDTQYFGMGFRLNVANLALDY